VLTIGKIVIVSRARACARGECGGVVSEVPFRGGYPDQCAFDFGKGFEFIIPSVIILVAGTNFRNVVG